MFKLQIFPVKGGLLASGEVCAHQVYFQFILFSLFSRNETFSLHLLCFQGNHLEPASGLPAGESRQPMGELHHMERWETRPEAVPMPEPGQSEESMLAPAALYSFFFFNHCHSHWFELLVVVVQFVCADINRHFVLFYRSKLSVMWMRTRSWKASTHMRNPRWKQGYMPSATCLLLLSVKPSKQGYQAKGIS